MAPADVLVDPGSTREDPERVVGTGPFVFQEWVPNDHATGLAFADYWGGAPRLDEFIHKVAPDQTAGVQQLRTGEIDWLSGIPGDSIGERLAFTMVADASDPVSTAYATAIQEF